MAGQRGRPRSYDPETALNQAMALIWDQGYADTSLDDLVQATGMNRPSLYGAFGDKKALYLATLAHYRALSDQAIDRAFGRDEPLRKALGRFFRLALDFYMGGSAGQRGCFLIGTATTGAAQDPEIRAVLREALRGFDRKLEARLRRAIEEGDLRTEAEPAQIARMLSAVLHSTAVRARAGEPCDELEATVLASISLICGPERN